MKRFRVPWPRVTVYWTDIMGDSGWSEADTPLGCLHVITRGWLLCEKDGVLSVAGSVGRDAHGNWTVSDRNDIPVKVAEVVYETKDHKNKKGSVEDGEQA